MTQVTLMITKILLIIAKYRPRIINYCCNDIVPKMLQAW